MIVKGSASHRSGEEAPTVPESGAKVASPPCYVQNVLEIFAKWGDEEAFVHGQRRLSFRDAHDTVLRLAATLRSQGIERGDGVAVLVGNRPETILVQLALHLLGARSVFPSIDAARREQADFVKHADTGVLLFDADSYPEDGPELARVNGISRIFSLGHSDAAVDLLVLSAAAPAVLPGVCGRPEDVVTVFYTSGTTSRPKLVAYRHASYESLLFAAAYRQLSTPERFLICTPLLQIGGQNSAMMTLLSGGTVVLLSEFDAGEALRVLERERITTTFVFPPMLYEILDHPDLPQTDLSSLCSLAFGASPTTPARLLQALEQFGPQLYQVYGMTEAIGVTMMTPQDRGPELRQRLLSCGRPLPGVEIRIADPDGKEIDTGEIGEVQVRGFTLMSGYWEDPEATATALDGGWLHTGDLGFVDEDGFLYLVDRVKDMIITGVGATNVYCGLVEDVLASHRGVAQAAVIGVPDCRFGEVVHAYVVPSSIASVSPDELRRTVRDELDELYVPRSVEFIDRLPSTALGKVDKQALRELFAS